MLRALVLSLAIGLSLNAQAGKSLKIFGGPGAIKAIVSHQAQLEKSIGGTIEFREQTADAAFIAVAKGFIDGLAGAVTAEELMEMDSVKAAKVGKTSDFEWMVYGDSMVKAVLHPDNPATSLTHEQLTSILTGKYKTWEPVTGKKDPIKIIFNRTQTATVKLVPPFYTGKPEIAEASMVTNVQGALKNIEMNPGAISFSGSRFEGDKFKPKFIETQVKIPYILVAKKPLSPELEKVFAALKKP